MQLCVPFLPYKLALFFINFTILFQNSIFNFLGGGTKVEFVRWKCTESKSHCHQFNVIMQIRKETKEGVDWEKGRKVFSSTVQCVTVTTFTVTCGTFHLNLLLRNITALFQQFQVLRTKNFTRIRKPKGLHSENVHKIAKASAYLSRCSFFISTN